MKRNGKVWMTALFALISILMVAGCSGGDEPEKETFRFGMSGLYKPFNFKENGKLTGFDVEIGEALAKKMGKEPEPVTNPFETIIPGLQADKYDAIIGSLTVTPEREKAVSFTDTYYSSGSQVFVFSENSDINGPEDLKGKKIGTVKASVYLEHALTLTDKANVIEYDSDLTALQDLPTGRLDAVITDQMVGFRVMKEKAIDIKDLGEPLSHDKQAIAVKKDDEELRKEINKALAAIIEDGTYAKISEKWFGRNILGEDVQ